MSFAPKLLVDAVNDAVWASFENVVLNTPADAEQWFADTAAAFEALRRPKFDLLINLDGLHVKSGAARAFGSRRAEVLSRYTRLSVRWGGDNVTRALIFTTAMLDSAPANVCITKDRALRELQALRLQGQPGGDPTLVTS